MKQTDISIGKNLRRIRIYNGMTQQELADRLGVSKAIISSYEQNKSMPNFNKLIEIARMFNVTTDYLLSHGDEYLDERFTLPPVTADPDEAGKAGKLSGRRMGIGAQIRELREAKGLSRQELADALSLSVTIIGKYENDVAAPSYGTLIEIARYFNVTTERLFGIDTGRKLDIRALPEDKKELIINLVGGMK
ncbi:MAG TPA: hypothetical protein DIS78_04580 [Lachnospiraceae bacterium]|nr:hypothetical protein [Lachnospiraceae bacterium]